MGVSWVSLEIIQIGEILCSEVFLKSYRTGKRELIEGKSPRPARASVTVLERWTGVSTWHDRAGARSWLSLCPGVWQEAPLPCNRILGFRPTGLKLVM